MILCLNGQFLSEDQARISPCDRGFLYGDSLFETLRVYRGRPFLWDQHLARLSRGAAGLRFPWPLPGVDLRRVANELIRQNQLPEAILRLQLTRGSGPRGYSLRQTGPPTWVMTLHPPPLAESEMPPRWQLRTVTPRLYSRDPLRYFKTGNRLLHILARSEAEQQGGDEALLLNEQGYVVETSSANLFWIHKDILFTPAAATGLLPGITRAVVMRIGEHIGWPVHETAAPPAELKQAQGLFLTLSTWELIEIAALDEVPFAPCPRIAALRKHYRDQVHQETGSRD